jgi:hypothetical protein
VDGCPITKDVMMAASESRAGQPSSLRVGGHPRTLAQPTMLSHYFWARALRAASRSSSLTRISVGPAIGPSAVCRSILAVALVAQVVIELARHEHHAAIAGSF